MSFLNSMPLEGPAATSSELAGDILVGAFLPAAGLSLPGGLSSSPSSISQLAKQALGQSVTSAIPGAWLLDLLGPDWLARIVTGLLGLLLIAAAIFTHPTVINVSKKIGKAAAEAGVAAA